MMRRDLLLSATCLSAVLLASSPAQAGWNLRLRGHVVGTPTPGALVDLLPGPTQPVVTNGAVSNVPINDVTPVFHGSSSDVGYDVQGFAEVLGPPIVEVGDVGVSETHRFTIDAHHTSTDVEAAAGLESNVSSAKAGCDGAALSDIGTPSQDPWSKATGFGFTVTSANYSDGLHYCVVALSPATGGDIVLNGPYQDEWGNFYPGAISRAAGISDGTGLAPGNLVTASGGTYNWRGQGGGVPGISRGMSLLGGLTRAGTAVDGTSAGGVTCGGACGSGSDGVYHVTGAPQLVPPVLMEFGANHRIWFVTNYHGTLRGNTSGVPNPKTFYVCGGASPVGCVGNDSTNTGLTPASPLATYAAALAKMITTDTASSTSYRGRWGNVLCMMGGGTYTISGSPAVPWSVIGATIYEGIGGPHCPAVAGDPGRPTLYFDPTTEQNSLAQHTGFVHLSFLNNPDNKNGGQSNWMYTDDVLQISPGLEQGGLLSGGGWGAFNSTTYFGENGTCAGCEMIVNHVGKYFVADAIHNNKVVIGSTFDAGGNIFEWMTADAVSGDKVLHNVTIPSGMSITAIFGTYGNLSFYPAGAGAPGCFPGSFNITTSDDVAHTITLDTAASSNCTAGHLGDATAHPDIAQITGAAIAGGLMIKHNSFNMTTNGVGQEIFLEGPLSGAVISDNVGRIDPVATYHGRAVTGGNVDVTFARNNIQTAAAAGMEQDSTSYTVTGGFNAYAPNPSGLESFIDETCSGPTPQYEAYGSARWKVPAVNACHAPSFVRCATNPKIVQTGSGVGSTVAITVADSFTVTPATHSYAWHRSTVSNNTVVSTVNATYTIQAGDVGQALYYQDDVTTASGPAVCASAALVIN